MNINWKVRIKNKNFWLGLIPAVILVIVTFAAIFGVTLDFGDLEQKAAAFVVAVFALLTVLGIVNDPTTSSLSDSEQALTYDSPKKD